MSLIPLQRQCTVCIAQRLSRGISSSSLNHSRNLAAVTATATPTSPGPSHSRPLSTSSPCLRKDYLPTSSSSSYDSKSRSRNNTNPVDRPKRPSPAFEVDDFRPITAPSPAQIAQLLHARIPEWTDSNRLETKLNAYGFTPKQASSVLREWQDITLPLLSEVANGDHTDPLSFLTSNGWDVSLLQDGLISDSWTDVYESSLLRHFLSYSSTSPSLPSSLRHRLTDILSTTDLSRAAFTSENLGARSLSRAFHLHIGPTNSGKTYSALKALSRAKTGAYAGPLRLLAHEVWERLNLGTVGDLNGQGRKCNLLTGEERRIVDPAAGLISCTVEMLPHLPLENYSEAEVDASISSTSTSTSTSAGPGTSHASSTVPLSDNSTPGQIQPYDVVVIDEIQMLGDPQRGGAWTNAVLGVMAREVHLCGDETTLNLLSSLIPSLGDTITIHRYDRLTPLKVAEESMDNDWNKVEKGDCVVTFSRSNIFAVKKMIESVAGKKCAVVYGALPPETRAEQAKDFNEGKAEVLVASDAVGMGLNLKIKRIIFESLVKWNGKAETPLALTQIKQIAGRAGRFGMHKAETTEDKDNVDAQVVASAESTDPKSIERPAGPDLTPSPGGIVTTLHKMDLPLLRSVLPLPLPSLPRAIFDVPFSVLQTLHQLLPPMTYAELLEHVHSLALLPPHTARGTLGSKIALSSLIEPYRSDLDLADIVNLSLTPVSARDPIAMGIFGRLIDSYAKTGLVEIVPLLTPSRLIHVLENVEVTLSTLPPLPPFLGIGRRPLTPPVLISSIPQLETLHKSLVAYIWLSFRKQLALPDRALAMGLKERCEKCLDECLERLPGLRNKYSKERSREMDGAVARWRRENVEPNGRRLGMDRKSLDREVRRIEREREERGEKVVWKSRGVGNRGKGIWGRVGVPRV